VKVGKQQLAVGKWFQVLPTTLPILQNNKNTLGGASSLRFFHLKPLVAGWRCFGVKEEVSRFA